MSFSREPRGLIAPGSLAIAPYDTTNQVVVSETDNEIVIRTNSLGQAGIVVKSTLPGLVDIDAENIATRNGGFGVQRVRCIRFAGDGVTLPMDGPTCVAPSDGGTTIPNPGSGGTNTPPAQNNTSTAVASAATVVSLAGTSPVAAKAPAGKAKAQATAKLASAKFVVIKGKRYLVPPCQGHGQDPQGPHRPCDEDGQGHEAGRARRFARTARFAWPTCRSASTSSRCGCRPSGRRTRKH